MLPSEKVIFDLKRSILEYALAHRIDSIVMGN